MDRNNPFEGKVALVTGAAGAIGFATSTFLAELGARVVAVDMQEDWSIDHPSIVCIRADLEDPPRIYELFTAIMDQEQRLDFVAHCVGLSIYEPWDEIRGDHIRKQLWVNAMSAVHITTQAANAMMGHSGHIALFGSGAEQDCREGYSVYAMCKAAVRAFGEAISRELSDANIFVNVIWPSAMSRMNTSSRHSPDDVAKFICGLFMTKKHGYVFSVAGDHVQKVELRELTPIDSVTL